MIRKATMEDFPQIIRLGFEEYLEEYYYLLGMNFSYLSLYQGYQSIFENPRVGCLLASVEDDGTINGFYSAVYLTSNLDYYQIVATETGWYVSAKSRGKGIGKALLKEATKVAYEMGIRIQRVSYPEATETGRGLGDWYKRMGYNPGETSAFKMITEEDFK